MHLVCKAETELHPFLSQLSTYCQLIIARVLITVGSLEIKIIKIQDRKNCKEIALVNKVMGGEGGRRPLLCSHPTFFLLYLKLKLRV